MERLVEPDQATERRRLRNQTVACVAILTVPNGTGFVYFTALVLGAITDVRELVEFVREFWPVAILIALLLANTVLLVLLAVLLWKGKGRAEAVGFLLVFLNGAHLLWDVGMWFFGGGTDRSWINFGMHAALFLSYVWCAANTRRYFRLRSSVSPCTGRREGESSRG